MEMLLRQIIAVEEARDTAGMPGQHRDAGPCSQRGLRGFGREFATVLWLEGFFRHLGNRRPSASVPSVAEFDGSRSSRWRKLTVALGRYVTNGLVPEGAVLRTL
jgi:hypothetical protein